jgi:hypothetical protein
MNQPTLGLLASLQPPPGFRTEAALGATYSADLLTCMAVLTTLDGADGDHVQYGRIQAYRALDRLRDRVRILHHAGCVSRRNGEKYPSLAMLDRLLVPIRLPRGSFHPKVWLVRQRNSDGDERFVLVVSSRNITTSADWDLGITLSGSVGGEGVELPRLAAFTSHVLGLAGDPERVKTLGALDAVRWTLPKHVRDVSFDFQEGGDGHRHLHGQWSALPPKPKRVLLLSPFIDSPMVREAASRWGKVTPCRLVAGSEGLTTVAVGREREALLQLELRQLIASSGLPDPADEEATDQRDDEVERVRALHAKVIAIDDGRRATIVLGSNNLTQNGWCGGSTEAFVRLTGDASLCDPLWDWAGSQAELFHPPDAGADPPEQPILERVKDALQSARFRLEDPGAGAASRLVLLDPPALALPVSVRLEVSRYTTPKDVVPFPADKSSVGFPGCPAALRTQFVVCTLCHGEDETSWIVTAELAPGLDDERDRALVARLLSVREFLAYLQALGGDETVPEPVEGGTDDHSPSPHGLPAPAEWVHLEGLLQQLVDRPEAFSEMDRTVQRYGALMKRPGIAVDEQALLDRFMAAWGAIAEAFEQ